MQYITATIHNNSLGQVKLFEHPEDAVSHITALYKDQFGEELDEEQIDSLENDFEIYVEEDHDNTYTFSIGIIE